MSASILLTVRTVLPKTFRTGERMYLSRHKTISSGLPRSPLKSFLHTSELLGSQLPTVAQAPRDFRGTCGDPDHQCFLLRDKYISFCRFGQWDVLISANLKV